MGHLGIEPRTYQLKAEYSTVELVALHKTNYKELSSFYAKITNYLYYCFNGSCSNCLFKL